MSFLSVLKAIGSGSLRVFGVAAPLVGALVPKSEPFISEAITIIGVIERAGASFSAVSASGTDKAKAALPLVAEALKATELVKGHKIVDADQFNKAAALYVDATVALLNSLEHKS